MQIIVRLDSLEELNRFLEGVIKAPETVAKAPETVAKAPAVVPVTREPEATPAPVKSITKQDVQTKAIALMDAGKQAQLQALLAKYNVPALPSLKDDQLAAFYADLEVL